MDLKGMSDEALRTLRDNSSAELMKRENRQLFHMVAREYMAKGRIQAIKLVRGVLGNGLREARIIVDYWAASEKWTTIPVETFCAVPNGHSNLFGKEIGPFGV